jgi:pimeloyl-ACP methyl ester carboxylesterase
LLDPAPCVLYLARVGQFQPNYAGKDYEAYWSDKRLSEEVVEAANSAIEQVKLKVGANRIHLIGYSGGGGLAILVAQRRLDVASIVTVAGLLDTEWWVQDRGWRPLSGSLNPIKKAGATLFIPQLHIYGLKDQIIPPEISARFARAARFIRLERVGQNNDHYSGWTKDWPDLLTKYVIPLRQDNPDTPPAEPVDQNAFPQGPKDISPFSLPPKSQSL